MRSLVILICAVSISGCCWMAKRDCFPPCPPDKVVIVEKKCDMPPKPTLPKVSMTSSGCPEDYVCFDKDNAAKLADKLDRLYTHIIDIRTRCGANEPASAPTTR